MNSSKYPIAHVDVAGGDAFYFQAGQKEDVETSRRVLADGTVIRVLLSGRVEVRGDGRSWRK
jgi:hypothetical protein